MVVGTTRKSINNITSQGEKIYEIFEKIGKEKMRKVKRISVRKLTRLNKEEIKEIVKRIKGQEEIEEN